VKRGSRDGEFDRGQHRIASHFASPAAAAGENQIGEVQDRS
jgi:hypothetical protein